MPGCRKLVGFAENGYDFGGTKSRWIEAKVINVSIEVVITRVIGSPKNGSAAI